MPWRAAAWQPWLGAGLLLGLALLTHAPALPGTFVWDDVDMISDGSLVQSPSGLADFWFSTKPPDYWPLAYTTHWLEWRLWGNWAPPYRALNLGLHALNGILLWWVLRLLRVPAAWWCAAIFLVHPVTVEAVAWILQRKTLLATAGALSALGFYLRDEEVARPRERWAGVLCFTLGMLSKSSIVLWPIVLLLLSAWRHGRLTREHLRRAAPYFVVSLVLGLVGVWFQRYRSIGEINVRDDGLLSRLLLAGSVVWFYLGKALWPGNLTFIYPRWPLEPSGLAAWLPDVALVAVASGLWLARKRIGTSPITALTYYVLNLVPVLGLINIFFMRYSLVADHWQYLSLPAVIALVVGGAAYLGPRWSPGWAARALPTGGALVIALLALLSMRHAALFAGADNGPLWRDVLKHDPQSWIAQEQLGNLLMDSGQFSAAYERYRQALAHAPESHEVHCNLGSVLIELGRPAEAEAELRTTLRIKPDMLLAKVLLAGLLARQGRESESAVLFREICDSDPANGAALLGYLRTFQNQKKHLEALAGLQALVEVHPQRWEPNEALVVELLALGRVDSAVDAAGRLVQRFPDQLESHLLWADALARKQQWEAASAALQAARRLAPGSARVELAAAMLDRAQGRHRQAAASLQKFLAAQPAQAEAQAMLGEELLLLGDAEGATRALAEALRLQPPAAATSPGLAWANNLAWTLATHADPRVRDGARALDWATRVCELAGRDRPELLDTLAVAQAAAGQFPAAIATTRRQIELLEARLTKQQAGSAAAGAADRAALATARERLALFERGQPYVEQAPDQP